MGKKSREKKEKKELGPIEGEEVQSGLPNILKWIIYAGTALAIFTPFIVNGAFFFPFVGLKSIYFMALVEIIFAAWLILIILKPKYRPSVNILAITIGLFLLVQILSSVFGIDFSRSFWSKFERMTGLLMQFHLFAFFLVISSVFRKKEDWLKLFGISALSAIVMSFINLFPQVGTGILGTLASADREGATLGNSSFLGTYLLFNFFFALYAVFNLKKWGWRSFFIAALGIIGVALYFSTARAALLSTIGGAVLLFFLWWIFQNKGKVRIIGVAVFVFAICGVAVATMFLFKPGNFLHTVYEKNVGPTFGGRIVVWESAWKGFLEKPALGWGPENFELVFTKYYNPCMGTGTCGGDVWYDRAHNIVFDTLVTTGAVGLLSYLSIFGASFYILWRKFFKGHIGFWAAGIFSVALIAYFLQNLTVFDMVNSYMLFFLLLGFIGTIASEREKDSQTERRGKPLLTGVILIAFVIVFWNFTIQPARADRDVINTLNAPIGSTQRLALYKKTLSDSPLGKYQIRDFFAENLLSAVQNPQISQVPKTDLQGEFDFIIQETEKTVQESPFDFRAYLKLGQLYNAEAVLVDPSKLANADAALQSAIKASPNNQQGYWALAQTKIYEGQGQEALSLSEQAVNLNPASEQSNLIVIQVAKIIGNNALAQQKAQEAIKTNPSWAADINSIVGTSSSP